MRRIAFTLALLLLAPAAVLAANAVAQDTQTYDVELDNAFGLVNGSEVRVAGVKAGTIKELDVNVAKKAVVTVEVSGDFGTFKEDATCSSEPQSLIAEYFLDCQPGQSETELEGPVPVEQTQVTVPNDLVQNTLREPFKRRLQLIINEFGTALTGNAENLNAAIRRGAPALRELRKVLKILGRQNRIIADLNTNSDAVIAQLTDRREDIVTFINEAEDTASASAERREDLARDFELLPGFLEQLRPTMVSLGKLAEHQTPLLIDLKAAAPQLNRLGKNLPRFNRAAAPSLQSLGGAAEVGNRALTKGRDEINELKIVGEKAAPAADIIATFLEDLDDPQRAVEEDSDARTDLRELPGEADRRVNLLNQIVPGGGLANPGYTGLEGLLNYAYVQTLALNLFDTVGHGLHVQVYGVPDPDNHCAHWSPGHVASPPGGGEVPKKGGGETHLASESAECVAWLGDTQPGITPGTWDPATGLTGNLPRYDNSVCPDGSTEPEICDPGISTSGAAQTLGAEAPSEAQTQQGAEGPQIPPDLLEELQDLPENTIEGTGVDQVLDGLGLGTGSTGSRSAPGTASGGATTDLLNFLLGA